MQPFQFKQQTAFYSGKVRDVYTIDDRLLVMLTSNRISAFDVILPRTIPFKGQVLNQLAAHMLRATSDVCPNWLLATPAPQVSIGRKCEPFKLEMVIRGNLTGHAWRTYRSGQRSLCGIPLPEGMKENDFFPEPIITPSTKAAEGHDRDISRDEILSSGLASEQELLQLEAYTRKLFERGRTLAAERGLILADTKYEFGKWNDTILLMDEIHTPDSSRYFYAEGFEERQGRGEKQEQLSKEFVREWLMGKGFMGKEGQTPPEMSDELVESISRRYIRLYEKITGLPFRGETWSEGAVLQSVSDCLEGMHRKK
jgi:phosphoribosylaminoimidazole-succinocarboxamide synthase